MSAAARAVTELPVLEPSGGYALRDLGESDAAAMLDVNRRCAVASGLVVRFDREPDLLGWPRRVFEGFQYVGAFAAGRLVAYGLEGRRRGWLGDRWGPWGYVGDFRVAPEHRGRGLSHRLADALAVRVSAGTVLWVALIARGNRAAERMRGAHRLPAGMMLEPLGALDVVTLPAWLPARERVEVAPLEDGDLEDAAAFVRATTAGRLLAPEVTADGLLIFTRAGGGRWCWVARRGGDGHIAGVLAASDPHACRQVTVLRYPAAALPLRAAWGLARRLRSGVPPLPAPGGELRGLTVSWLVAADADAAVARALLTRAAAAARTAGLHVVHVGFAAGDPLARAVRGWPRSTFRSHLSAVVRRSALVPVLTALGRPVCFDLELA